MEGNGDSKDSGNTNNSNINDNIEDSISSNDKCININ